MKAVLFDLDGTLANTLDDLADSMNWCLCSLGFQEHPTDSYRYFIGDGITMLCRRVLPAGAEGSAAALEDMMRQRYSGHSLDRTRPYPGVPELLAALAARGIPFCVFSNKPHGETVKIARALFPGIEFAGVQGQQPGLPRKPDPAGALLAAQSIGIEPADFLYVGDTATDMQTALAAGMTPVGVLWGFRDRAELSAAGAAHIVSRPDEILEILDGGRSTVPAS
ncbi:MAG TPA: HAD family hydrolase [Candidatus Brocadiia bacterium]|nr:HAD family hydrolase [Candidatus Brocadiia bacterium]